MARYKVDEKTLIRTQIAIPKLWQNQCSNLFFLEINTMFTRFFTSCYISALYPEFSLAWWTLWNTALIKATFEFKVPIKHFFIFSNIVLKSRIFQNCFNLPTIQEQINISSWHLIRVVIAAAKCCAIRYQRVTDFDKVGIFKVFKCFFGILVIVTQTDLSCL